MDGRRYRVFVRDDGHGLFIVKLFDTEHRMTFMDMYILERTAVFENIAYRLDDKNNLVCEVNYVCQN